MDQQELQISFAEAIRNNNVTAIQNLIAAGAQPNNSQKYNNTLSRLC
jgi:ankyrin repeat protein